MRNLHINNFLAQFVRNITTFRSYGQTEGVLDAGGGGGEDYCVGDAVGGVGKEEGRAAGGQAEGEEFVALQAGVARGHVLAGC